ncbi:MAG: glycosyltransferase, partial [Gemmatimonadota bacterium]|nr:glycosyltransferase [Gemmatimonadota bacterium]
HTAWHLWVRDDASTDGTADRVAAWAARDPRITLRHRGTPNLGVVAGFAWLLDQLPDDTEWVACLDADDVWAPNRLAATLAAAEQAIASGVGGRPLLVHSDCRLIDADGKELAPSYWTRAGLSPTPTALRRIAVQNVATSSTMLMNRALLDRLRPMPTTGIFSPDWWFTMVASAFGEIIAVPASLIGYRQHTTNDVGATRGRIRDLPDLISRIGRWQSTGERLRRDLRRMATQAATFRKRYDRELADGDHQVLQSLAALPDLSFLPRKVSILRHRLRAEHGLLRNLGLLLRA